MTASRIATLVTLLTALTSAPLYAQDGATCPVPNIWNPKPVEQVPVTFDTVNGGTPSAEIYTPTGEGPHPGILVIHGGGWQLGGPPLSDDISRHLARTGFVVMNTSYRFLGQTKMRGIVRDTVCAMRWLNAHATELGIAPGCTGVMGDSAGGHLAAMIALAGDDPAFRDGCEQAGDATADVRFAAPLYGSNDWSLQLARYGAGIEAWWDTVVLEPGEPWQTYSPIEHIGGKSGIDFFLSHGRKD